jgi:FKBP-type peptidyl-prolyl cis-trans isomerase (trigger factor)
MKIRAQNREGNTVKLEIEEDYSKFLEAVDKTIVEVSRDIKIPGFRPGKAPKEMVEKALDREAVEARAAQNLISELYPQIIDEAKIDPVDYPNVEILQQKKKKPFVFKVSVDVYPEVKLGKYKGLKAEKKEAKVTDEDINKVLENFRQRLAQMEKGEKKEPPPLDNEFVKKVSRFQTLEELKNELRQGMQRDRESESEADVRNKLIAAASAETKVDIPNGMIEKEIDIMLDELRTSLAQSNLTLEDYLKGIKKEGQALREELRKSAEIRVRGKVVLRAIAENEKMKISDEEFEKEINELAKASGQKPEELKKTIDEGAKKYIEDYMLRRNALDFLVEKAKIKEVGK